MSAVANCSRITPFLWFDQNAEDAVAFYLTIFKNSRKLTELRNPAPEGKSYLEKDKVMTIAFELDGQKFVALNGGPMYKFTEAISFVISCDTQKEIDHYWENLSAGGSEIQCGWLKDKFGLTWQVVPARISELLRHPKAMQAMMGMKKLNIAELEGAAKS